jgi:hypothetical protein
METQRKYSFLHTLKIEKKIAQYFSSLIAKMTVKSFTICTQVCLKFAFSNLYPGNGATQEQRKGVY